MLNNHVYILIYSSFLTEVILSDQVYICLVHTPVQKHFTLLLSFIFICNYLMYVGVFFALDTWLLQLDGSHSVLYSFVMGIVLKQSTGTNLMCMLFQCIFFYKHYMKKSGILSFLLPIQYFRGYISTWFNGCGAYGIALVNRVVTISETCFVCIKTCGELWLKL